MPKIPSRRASPKEVIRLDSIQRFIDHEITRVHAAKLIGITSRQVQRLAKAFRDQGPSTLTHGHVGRTSNNAVSEDEREVIKNLLIENYHDFGPTLATEHLHDDHGVVRHPTTIRQIMIEMALWKPKKNQKNAGPHRTWRQRRSAFGELEQFDGSYHDWFEGRGGIDEACLLAAIDDATGRITKAEFAPHEGVFPVFAFWQEYLKTHGKPRAIYLDKFSTYKMNSAVARENPDLKTQFQRAMETLQIEPIFANSPQAKGRVERLFQTLQDRLPKALRLAGISTVAEANKFLEETFIPFFNQKFAVVPTSDANLHWPLTEKETLALPSILSRHESRTIQNDFTIAWQKQWLQLTPHQPVTVCRRDVVTVEEHLDRTIHLRLRGKELNYVVLPERPKKIKSPVVIAKTAPATWKPAPGHPWRHRPI